MRQEIKGVCRHFWCSVVKIRLSSVSVKAVKNKMKIVEQAGIKETLKLVT